MSDELNAGIKIFLERCKSNPDEVTEEYGKWEGLVNAVFAYVEEGRRQSVLRGLTDEEIRTLFETLNGMYREKFASRIMGHVLRGDAEEAPQREFVYAASQGKQRLQGSMQPGTWVNVANQSSSAPITLQGNTTVQGQLDAEPSPAFLQKIKQGLGL
jgi:hypothetical protein